MLGWFLLAWASTVSAAPDPGPRRAVHLTIDDLPWQLERGQTMALPAEEVARWNRQLLAVLKQHDVSVSAFFTCDRIQPGDGSVTAWSEAGHALGNHTASHLPAKKVGPTAFLENAASCQKTLTEAGAEVRWFRYPYLGYGADAASQQAIADGLEAMGLRDLPVTATTSEWVYATAYRKALADGDTERQARIRSEYLDSVTSGRFSASALGRSSLGWRYSSTVAPLGREFEGIDSSSLEGPPSLNYMLDALDAAERISEALEGRPIPQTVLIHANELNGHVLDELITRYKARGVTFLSADDTMADPVFAKPVQRIESWAVPWVVRVHAPVDGAPDPKSLQWFSQAERRAIEAWPLPPAPWHRGVPMP
jgi:peptidoglycan/xylan/chitin deacetylase (PgdA/CDA1 family)